MLIGFGFKPDEDGTQNDEVILRKIGCERSFFWSDRSSIKEELGHVMEFLRPQDVLVVVELDRLDTEFFSLLQFLDRLHKMRIGLQIHRSEVVAGTPFGDAFLKSCSILADTLRVLGREETIDESPASGRRRRGRPPALSKTDQARARQLLYDRHLSVMDVSRKLRVSVATIYRYFPRRRSDHGK